MCQRAWGIYDHLPIRCDPIEEDYIHHLRRAFFKLELTYPNALRTARPFSIMPLHLLFMVAVQYKVLRIYRERRNAYRARHIAIKKAQKRAKNILWAPTSPLEIAYLSEHEILNFLKVAGLSTRHTKRIYNSIIKYRNKKIAHAWGYIEPHLKLKINEYFGALDTIQVAYQHMNRSMANDWLNKVQKGDDIGNFLEKRFLNSLLCPRDLADIVRAFVASPKLSHIQHNQAFQKLQDINIKNSYDCSRFKHIRS